LARSPAGPRDAVTRPLAADRDQIMSQFARQKPQRSRRETLLRSYYRSSVEDSAPEARRDDSYLESRGQRATDPHSVADSVEGAIANYAENLQFLAVFLTHSPPGTTVPRLANPDQKSDARKRSRLPPSFVSPAVGMKFMPRSFSSRQSLTPRKGNTGT